MNALVIEDDPLTSELFVDALRDCGFDTRSAFSAEEAVRVWQQSEGFDFITLDLGLAGGSSGLEFCRWLRLQEGGEDCFVLAITGRSDPEDLRAVLDAGANDYLPKPVKLDMLLVRLAVADAHIEVTRQHRQASETSRQNAACYRALQELTSDAVMEIDRLEDRVLTANSAATALLGWNLEELQRRRAEEILPLWAEIKEPGYMGGNSMARTHDGSRLDVSLRVHPMRFGSTDAMLCVFRKL